MPGAEPVKADLTKYREVADSVRGSDVVYLLAGLPYNSEIWERDWPVIMRNTLDAVQEAGARLIFFDNVYMYGRVSGPMTEDTPFNPCSRKGEVRARIATMVLEEMARSPFGITIARSADFYGPWSEKNSLPHILVFDPLLHGGKARWMANAGAIHSFTYTLDCARALYRLAVNTNSYNQVWHLPTFNPPPDGRTFIAMAARELGAGSRYTVMRKGMVKIAGLFNQTISELHEMLYQNEYDYYFDSSKFNRFFNYQPVSYEQGIRETLDFLRKG